MCRVEGKGKDINSNLRLHTWGRQHECIIINMDGDDVRGQGADEPLDRGGAGTRSR